MYLLQQIVINSRFKYHLLVFLSLLVISGTVLAIWSMNRLSTVGDQLAQLERSKSSLELQNQLLENQIAQKKSLTNVAEASKALGFQKISEVEYVSDSGLALNQ